MKHTLQNFALCTLASAAFLACGSSPKNPPSHAPIGDVRIARVESPPVDGAGTIEDFDEKILEKKEALSACYSDGLSRNAKLKGSVYVRLTITPAGRIGEVSDGVAPAGDTYSAATLPDQNVVRCVLERVKEIRFMPRAKEGRALLRVDLSPVAE